MRWQIEEHACVDSTNRLALAALRAGAAEGTVIAAAGQTAGRGRLAREWWSPNGHNLYISAILRPQCVPGVLGPFPLVAGVGIMAGLEEIAGQLQIQIKWPNDLYVQGKKLAGILVESVLSAGQVDGLVVGLGVNINAAPQDFPPDLRATATSLAQATGRTWDLALVRDAVLQGLGNAYRHWLRHGFRSVRPLYDVRSYLEGRHVCVTQADGRIIRGVVRGVTLQGALQVVDPTDTVHEVIEGDLQLEETACR